MRKLLLLLGLAVCATAFAAPPGYHIVSKIQLGGDGGWDYLYADSAARRLYISRGTHVMVVDLDTEKLVGDIPDTPGVHGIAVAPELGRGFTSNGRASTATIFDLQTLKPLGEVKTGSNPDAILYDPAAKHVFTFNGGSKDATAFEASTGEVLATIPLGGKPEFSQTDGKGNVFVNIEDTNEVARIDSRSLTVTQRWSLKPGEEPTGMGLDARRERVFSVCHNKLMTVMDGKTGQVIATVPIGAGTDGSGYDPRKRLAFSSNGEGTLTVVREASPGKFAAVETVKTERGARTMAVDPKTHKVYLPTAKFGPAPKPTAEMPRPRPTMVKGSFALLVVGP